MFCGLYARAHAGSAHTFSVCLCGLAYLLPVRAATCGSASAGSPPPRGARHGAPLPYKTRSALPTAAAAAAVYTAFQRLPLRAILLWRTLQTALPPLRAPRRTVRAPVAVVGFVYPCTTELVLVSLFWLTYAALPTLLRFCWTWRNSARGRCNGERQRVCGRCWFRAALPHCAPFPAGHSPAAATVWRGGADCLNKIFIAPTTYSVQQYRFAGFCHWFLYPTLHRLNTCRLLFLPASPC